MLKIFYIFITSLIFLSSANAETVKVFEFTEKELSALEIRKVRGAVTRLLILLDQMRMVIF